MSDYFEKLGNLLNEALEKGEIPAEEKKETVSEPAEETISKEQSQTKQTQEESAATEKVFRTHFFQRKKQTPTAQIIKNNEYTYNFQLSPELQAAFNLLGLIYPCTWKEVNRKYHTLLKQIHPDTKKSEQQSTTQINDLQDAYQKLKQFYKK